MTYRPLFAIRSTTINGSALRVFTGIGSSTRLFAALFCFFLGVTESSTAWGQVNTAGYEADYEASGFVAPAGMPSPEAYYSQIEQAGFFGPQGTMTSQMQGCESGMCGSCGGCDQCGACGCDSGGCDSGCCGGGCGCCGGGCCLLGGCGLCGMNQCNEEGLNNWRYCCIFCRGQGCSACQYIGRGYCLAALKALLPYGEAGLCAQRWYDYSADVMFLGHTNNTSDTVLTTQGTGGGAIPVLRANQADDSNIAAGMRFSGAWIFGAGANIEATYLGNNEWGKTATATSATPTLYSFISNFGATLGGFDDTDRSFSQSINTYSTLHSAEINYRRRTVEQYCRFQGSWLAGLRYVRFDDDFGYSTIGQVNNAVNPPTLRFYNFRNEIDNKLFGPQLGFDLWWNVIAGVNLGIGAKGAWMDNNIDRRTTQRANSIGPLATVGTSVVNDGYNRGAFMTEFETTLLYRISHSWTLKAQYYLLSIDHVAEGFDISGPTGLGRTPQTIAMGPIRTDGVTFQGFSLGAEYVW